jgi:pimeloyl-ACP methyl ester carboxylesterase
MGEAVHETLNHPTPQAVVTTPVQGGDVVWRRFGGGPPVVLFHGGHGSWLHWARNIQALALHFTVWVPDLPGYGDSTAVSAPHLSSIVQLSSHALDAAVGTETEVKIVAFSFGSLVAAQLAHVRGGVDQVVLVGPAGHGGPSRPMGSLLPWRHLDPQDDRAALASVMRHNLCMHMLHDPQSVDGLALQIHTAACAKTRFHSKRFSRSAALLDVIDELQMPQMMIWGEHDVTADPELLASQWSARRADRRCVVLPHGGHWIAYERASEFNQTVLSWLTAAAPGN